jgi:Alpha-L-arabinofuranosidase B, catalytic
MSPPAAAEQDRPEGEQLVGVPDHVHVQPVLDRLRLRHRVDPDQRPGAGRVVDGNWPAGWPFRTLAGAVAALVSQRGAPPVGEHLMVAGIQAQVLEPGSHGAVRLLGIGLAPPQAGSRADTSVAAQSATRALFAAYNGNLYQVRGAADHLPVTAGEQFAR